MLRFCRNRASASPITLADRARNAAEWELAAQHYRTALDRNSKNPPIWVQYGHALKESGNLLQAEDAYRRAIELDPSAADPYLHLGHLLKIQGRNDEASAAYLRSLALDPKLEPASFELSGLGWTGDIVREVLRADLPVCIGREKTHLKFEDGTFFDDRLYRALYGAHLGPLAENGLFLYYHYLKAGRVRGFLCHIPIDEEWYKAAYPEAAEALRIQRYTNIFLHYLCEGAGRGLSPSADFDEQWYRQRYPEINTEIRAGLYISGYQHYLLLDPSEMRDPNPYFSETDYREEHPPIAGLISAGKYRSGFDHFCKSGRQWPGSGLYNTGQHRTSLGRNANGPENGSIGTVTAPSKPSSIPGSGPPPISSRVPTCKSKRNPSRSRLAASDDDIAIIAAYFETDGARALLGDAGFEVFTAEDYLKNPSLWSYAPHYLFDVSWYLGQLVELLDPGVNPFLHFLRVGVFEGKSPHPLFDPQFYVTQWRDKRPGASVEHVFDHYLRYGSEQDISPHRLFSASRYRRLYLNDVERAVDPLKHYLLEGYRLGFNPHPLFDEYWYRSMAGNLYDVPGLVDYVVRGAVEGLDPHPLFRTRYFLHQNPNLRFERTPLEGYLADAGYSDPHPLFSTSHYLSQLDDTDGLTPLEHFVEEGWREGFDPHPFFRTDWYNRQFSDIAERPQNPLVHYEKVGRGEGRGPNPFFDPIWYTKHFMSQDETELPEQHYLSTGLANDFPGRDTDPLHSGSLLRLPNIPKVALHSLSGLPAPAINPQIGVFLHAYYPELGEEIFGYLNNIPELCTVYVSTDSAAKAQILRETANRCLRHTLEIRILPNRGRDIAPWLVGFADRMREIDIGIHLHTKKSPHANSDMDAWRRYLFDGLVGSPETVAAHLKILSHERVGASLVEHFYPLIRVGEINWGHNLQLVRKLLALCNIEISDQTPLEFPSGSMFWFKTCALEPLLKLALRFEFFEPEIGAVDGTLAHAIERSLLYVVEAAGFGWVQVTAQQNAPEPTDADPIDLETFLANGGVRLIPTNRRSRSLRRLLPLDVLPFNTNVSQVKRPRLNLVVPTIDRTLGYAGLSNGFELFFQILGVLGKECDARILGTGHEPTVRFSPPEGFTLVELGEFDWPGRSVVCDATQRTWRLLDLRRADIFLATAWQTAHIASLLCEDQSRLFGVPLQKFIYLIQDYEPPFHPWSSLYYLADATYRDPARFDAVFNTEVLASFFRENKGIDGYVYKPALNPQIARHVRRVDKQKNCLIYYRTHAVRNCHELCEIIVEELVARDLRFYADWRFLAIGEGRPEPVTGSRIERLGRLSLEEYGRLLSRSAIGLSLMVSPHPSYPPLEMAAGGLLVLTNAYGVKDLSLLHENIVCWRSGRISDAVDQLDQLCRAFDENYQIGWKGRAKVDWFFSETDNLQDIACALAGGLLKPSTTP